MDSLMVASNIKRLSWMEMEGDRKELLKSMCNLSQGIKEQGIEQGRREERISTLVTFFKNDGTVAAAKQMLNSSDEDIKIFRDKQYGLEQFNCLSKAQFGDMALELMMDIEN